MIPLGLVAFALFGVVLVLLGATADALRASLELSLQQFGFLGSAFAFGMGIGVVGAGPLVDRFARRPIFVAAGLLTTSALYCVGESISYSLLVLCVVGFGMGAGVVDTLMNAVTAERYPERSVQMLSLLHGAVTIGAMAAPLAIERILAVSSFARVFEWSALGFLLLSVGAAFVSLPRPPERHPHHDPHAGLATPAFVGLCVVGFCYVGVEAGLVLFAVPYAAEGIEIGSDAGRTAISAFWFGILGARGALALPRTQAAASMGSLAVAAFATALLLVASVALEWKALSWIFAAIGLLIGFVFPVMIAAAATWNPGAAGVATGIVAGAGSLGAVVVPWLTGWIGDAAGVRSGLGSLVVWCGLLALAAAFAGRAHDRERTSAGPVLD